VHRNAHQLRTHGLTDPGKNGALSLRHDLLP
jgi:hypothetical protein